MDTDLVLVIGIVIAVLTIPSLLAAFSEGRAPRMASIMVLVAGVLIILALSRHPGGYTLQDIPDAFYRVFNRYVL